MSDEVQFQISDEQSSRVVIDDQEIIVTQEVVDAVSIIKRTKNNVVQQTNPILWAIIALQVIFILVLFGVLAASGQKEVRNKNMNAKVENINTKIPPTVYKAEKKEEVKKKKEGQSLNIPQNSVKDEKTTKKAPEPQHYSPFIFPGVSKELPQIIKDDRFTLWDLSADQKQSILKNYDNLPSNQRRSNSDSFIQITKGKDAQFAQFSANFQKDVDLIDWSSNTLGDAQMRHMNSNYNNQLEKRVSNIKKMQDLYKRRFYGKSGYLKTDKQITYKQLLDNLEYMLLTGQNHKDVPRLKQLYQRQKKYHEDKYKVNNYKEQIHACIVAPTYKNVADYRYAWHIQSILQQQYGNWRMVIIDDMSSDNTYQYISKYLTWKNPPKDKIILLRNKVHRTAVQNIYYTTHKYCDYNQIAYIIDGDDEIIGTQVFKLFNALYQQHRLYVLYSNFITYNFYYQNSPLDIGLSVQYPPNVIKDNGYRHFLYHAYGHLRTMMTDIFLLMNSTSLKDNNGKFYWTLYDNAIYYPGMQMACQRVKYVRQLKYWYTANTGLNDWRTNRKKQYSAVAAHIRDTQKPYQCIHHVIKQMHVAIQTSKNNH